MTTAHLGALASLAVSLALEAKRAPKVIRYCHREWPLQDCEMTRQQKRAAARGEERRRG